MVTALLTIPLGTQTLRWVNAMQYVLMAAHACACMHVQATLVHVLDIRLLGSKLPNPL